MKQSFRSETAGSIEEAARELVRNGPVLPVVITSLANRDRVQAKALIDTGAQANCMSPRLARKLSLNIIGDTWVAGVSSNNEIAREKVDTVMGLIRPGDIPVDLPSEFATPRFSTGDDQIEILLGRPFLQNFDLVYEGSIGRFSLAWHTPALLYQDEN